MDEFTRESLAIQVRCKLFSSDVIVIDVLTDLFIPRGIPAYIRSDNGPEFVAETVRRWIATVGLDRLHRSSSAWTAFIDPGSPWQNGYIESFNARLRGERLDAESSGKSRLSSKPGGAITVPSAHAAAWDTGRRPRKRSSCQAGRPAPLRRSPSLAEKPSTH